MARKLPSLTNKGSWLFDPNAIPDSKSLLPITKEPWSPLQENLPEALLRDGHEGHITREILADNPGVRHPLVIEPGPRLRKKLSKEMFMIFYGHTIFCTILTQGILLRLDKYCTWEATDSYPILPLPLYSQICFKA